MRFLFVLHDRHQILGPTCLLELGVYMADSAISTARAVSTTGGAGFCFTSIVSPTLGFTEGFNEDDGFGGIVGVVGAEVAMGVGGSSSVLGDPGVSFFCFNLASSPSTLFSRASRTSVLGPLFFGTASVRSKRTNSQFRYPRGSQEFCRKAAMSSLDIPYTQGHWKT